MFQKITPDEFQRVLADAPVSPAFGEEFSRHAFDHGDPKYLDAAIQHGSLHVDGPLQAPAFFTLVLGDLTVDGAIDLRSGYDQGGMFIVIGNVRCRHFIGEVDAAVFIDGDLRADEAVLVGYSDSTFVVVGTLRARLFIGNDIWALVGDGAVLDYGIGYCAPLGSDGAPRIGEPRHGEAATIRALLPEPATDGGYPFDVEEIADLIRAGRPVFR